MQLLQQNWYVVRLVPPPDSSAWAPSWLCNIVNTKVESESFRWVFVAGLVFYGNFQRCLPREPAPAKFLAIEQGSLEWHWYMMPSPDNLVD